MEHQIEIEYLTLGPVSATASTSGDLVVIDFPRLDDPSKALRLAFPSDRLEDFAIALRTVQKALADPASGIHYQQPH
jgi:hypothetical protein